ncbi:MAG: hypothetical protein JW973_04980 [Bacteroidales bacterium]|nr:hypothetical protein [Bacteroidales bacterium]
MKFNLFFMTLTVAAVLLNSCENENSEESGDYRYGVFILNEGSFNANNASVSHYDPVSGMVTNNLFKTANGRPLGDVVQSLGIAGETAYIVVNGSGKVEIVNLKTFRTIAEPIIASYPRCFLAVDAGKGYLTNGKMQGYVYIVDLKKFTVRDSVELGMGPESMIKWNDKVYIANSGGWGLDSIVSIVDISTDKLTGTIDVGDVPSDMVMDKDNNLWVYCKGYATYSWDPPYNLISETAARLVKINTTTNTIIWEGVVGTAGQYTAVLPKLAISAEGDILYFLRPDGIYKIEVGSPSTPGELVLEGNFYGLDVNPDSDELFVFQSSFTGNGSMYIVNTVTGNIVTHTVGIGPSGAVFNLE